MNQNDHQKRRSPFSINLAHLLTHSIEITNIVYCTILEKSWSSCILWPRGTEPTWLFKYKFLQLRPIHQLHNGVQCGKGGRGRKQVSFSLRERERERDLISIFWVELFRGGNTLKDSLDWPLKLAIPAWPNVNIKWTKIYNLGRSMLI